MAFDNDMVSPARSAERVPVEGATRIEVLEPTVTARDATPGDAPIGPKGYIPTPFPLGPNRLAYLSLTPEYCEPERIA